MAHNVLTSVHLAVLPFQQLHIDGYGVFGILLQRTQHAKHFLLVILIIYGFQACYPKVAFGKRAGFIKDERGNFTRFLEARPIAYE